MNAIFGANKTNINSIHLVLGTFPKTIMISKKNSPLEIVLYERYQNVIGSLWQMYCS